MITKEKNRTKIICAVVTAISAVALQKNKKQIENRTEK